MRPRQPETLPVRLTRRRIYVLPTASGLFFSFVLGTMMLGALNWSNFIEGLGIITAVCVTLAIAGWLALLHFKIRVEGL